MNRVVSPRQRWRVNLPVVIWVWLCLYVAVTSFQYLISGEQISLLRFFFNGGLLLVALLDIARRQVAEVFQHSQESIIIADSKGTILNVNPAFTRITGYALEEARGKNPRILSSGRQNRQFYEDLFKQLRAEGFWSGQFWNKRKNGEHYLQRGTISAVFGDSGKPEHYIAIMEDASVYREAEERIQALANYDALGHYYGDELLKAVCKRLKLHVKETDTLCRFGGDEFILLMQGGAKEAGRSKASGGPISLYTHLPFCAHLCYYCACNKVITKKRDKAMPYVERVLKEAAIQSKLFGADRPVQQLHWGGGTPTFLPRDVMQHLMAGYGELFNLQSGDERDYSVEIDPREVDEDTLSTLWELGFNRISLGVQDVNPEVQKAVNRIQPREMTEAVLNEARRIGFRSINLDLIYGLPHQTPESFAETLESVIEMSPDRLSVFSYAHLPDRFYPQTRIQADTLPSPQQKLTILHNTINRLLEAGYEYIGMDHFAKPDDSLAVAQREGRLHRNFQGYTTHSDCDLVSLGVSAIGQTDDAYFQNNHDLPSWEASIDAGQLAIIRGVGLTRDDRIRRWVIGQLICQFRLDRKQFADKWNEDFDRYFADEMSRLKPMIQDELIADSGSVLQVQPAGRLLIRAICQIFDLYRKEGASQRFSRII